MNNISPMSGFKPRTSGVECDPSTNWPQPLPSKQSCLSYFRFFCTASLEITNCKRCTKKSFVQRLRYLGIATTESTMCEDQRRCFVRRDVVGHCFGAKRTRESPLPFPGLADSERRKMFGASSSRARRC